MTIEPYNYNDEPSGRSETLVQALDKIELLEKQLEVAENAINYASQRCENCINGVCQYCHLSFVVTYYKDKEKALKQIKDIAK